MKASEQIRKIVDESLAWLETVHGVSARVFSLYGDALELIAENVGLSLYEEFCSYLNGQWHYENRILNNLYRLFSVGELDVYAYYTDSEHRLRAVVAPRSVYPLAEDCHFTSNTAPTLSVLNMSYELQPSHDNGLGLILTLDDGSFVIYDGGFLESDADRIRDFLTQRNTRADGICITAWIITHGHEDHYGAFVWFLKKYHDLVKVKYFLLNPINHCGEGKDYLATVSELIDLYYTDATKLIPYTGMKFQFQNIRIEVLFTHQDILPLPVTCFNDASTITKITSPDGTTLLVTGDIQTRSRSSLLQNNMREYMKSDILQVPHHGDSGGTPDLYSLIDPHTVIYSTSNDKYERIRSEDWALAPNVFLLEKMQVKRVILADGGIKDILLTQKTFSD